jgi:hypothetical protein
VNPSVRRFAFILCLLLFPAISRAAAICPWINATTAFGALGAAPEDSSVKSVVTANSCTFTYQTASTMRELRVTVDQLADAAHNFEGRKAACAAGAKPLHAIGNEAVTCLMNAGGNLQGEEVIGRVRDQVFTLTLTEKMSDPAAGSKDLPQKAEMLAELVAGNLF